MQVAATLPGRLDVLAWAALLVAAAGVVLYATVLGIGVTADSTAYFSLARRGLERFALAPVAVPPAGAVTGETAPLYPAMLAAASVVLQQDPEQAARWLHVLLLPLNLLLVGLLLKRALPGARVVPWLGACAFLLSVNLVAAHTRAWTEPAFLSFVLLGVWALDRYLADAKPSRLMVAIGLASAACLTRPAGVAFAMTIAAALFLWGPGPLGRRTVVAAGAGVAAFALMFAWTLFVPGYRDLVIHLPPPRWFVTGRDTMAAWVVPDHLAVPRAARMALTAAAFALVAAAFTGWPEARRDRLGPAPSRAGAFIAPLLGLFATGHVLVLLATRIVWDANVPMDMRTLVPAQTSAVLLFFIGLGRVVGAGRVIGAGPVASASRFTDRDPALHRRNPAPISRQRLLRAAAVAVVVLSFGVALPAARAWLVDAHRQGYGYTSRIWLEAEIIRAVAALPANAYLVSNRNDAIIALTGRLADRLPDRVNPATLVPNPNYETAMARLLRDLRARDGFVVYATYRERQRWYIPGPEELTRRWPLNPVVVVDDGTIYRVREDSEEP